MDKYRTFLNVTIQILSSLGALFGLWLASIDVLLYQKLIGVLLFAMCNNTLFSLMHESVHKIYSKNKLINEMMGIFSSVFFPTGFTFQRLCHLAHHCNNRTDNEMFDQYYETDNLYLKKLQFYGIFTGFYWVMLVFGWLVYFIFPGFFRILTKMGERYQFMKHADVAILLPFERTKKKIRIRLELAFVIVCQVFIFYFLSLNIWWTLLCYWIFALFWGGLQYADHAFSPRDIRKGAWDLRINPIMRLVFLNYHHHRAHHMHPKVPWYDLGKYIDYDNYRPRFLDIYIRMWKGPIKAKEASPVKLSEEQVIDIYQGKIEDV